MTMAKGSAGVHSGSSFDDFLEEEGYRNDVESVAIKRVLAWQFEQEMIRHRYLDAGRPCPGQAFGVGNPGCAAAKLAS
jgi:hypothetical protein